MTTSARQQVRCRPATITCASADSLARAQMRSSLRRRRCSAGRFTCTQDCVSPRPLPSPRRESQCCSASARGPRAFVRPVASCIRSTSQRGRALLTEHCPDIRNQARKFSSSSTATTTALYSRSRRSPGPRLLPLVPPGLLAAGSSSTSLLGISAHWPRFCAQKQRPTSRLDNYVIAADGRAGSGLQRLRAAAEPSQRALPNASAERS